MAFGPVAVLLVSLRFGFVRSARAGRPGRASGRKATRTGLTYLRHVLLDAAPGGSLGRHHHERPGLLRFWRRFAYGNACVAAFARRLVQRDLAEELEAQLFCRRLCPAVAKDVIALARIRRDEVAHVLNYAE